MDQSRVPIKISIVTATHNRAEFLPRCIESVGGQSYPDKEHIIIDGGSTDSTVSVLRSFASKYPHIQWISETDKGISEAFNKGLARATGDVIGIIGDDDFYEPEVFRFIAEQFAADPSISVLSGDCNFVDNDGAVRATQTASYTSRAHLIEGWLHWGKQIRIAAPSTFIRKRVIDEVGGFDENDRYAMDYHHWLKITERFPAITTVPRVFANFRLDQGTVSFSEGARQWTEMLTISRKYWGPKSSRMYYRLLFSYLRHCRWVPLKNRLRSRAARLLRGSPSPVPFRR